MRRSCQLTSGFFTKNFHCLFCSLWGSRPVSIFCLDFLVDCWSELEIETDIASAKCVWLALPYALSSLALKWFYVTMSLSFSLYQNRPCVLVSWKKTLLHALVLLQACIKLPDDPVSSSGLIIYNCYILEIGEGSQVSSCLALGWLPPSGSSCLRHFMIHLCSFIPHRRGPLCSRLLFHLLIPIACQSNYFPPKKIKDVLSCSLISACGMNEELMWGTQQ